MIGAGGSLKQKLFKAGLNAVVRYAGNRAIGRYQGKPYLPKNKGRKEEVDMVTGQKDFARIRVNKRKSRRAKKWKKFAKRVQKANVTAQIRTLSKTAVQGVAIVAADLSAIRQGALTWGGVGRQRLVNITLCAYSGTNQQINDDLNEMAAILYNSQTDAETQNINTPIYVKSALWEIMLTNFGTNAQYCDVYHYVCKKSCEYDPQDFIAQSDAQVRPGGAPTAGTNYITAPDVEDYGWTPYQNRNIMRHVQIYRKERYLMPAGDTIQLEKRIAINKIWRKEQNAVGITGVQNKMHKNITHGMFFIVYGTPSSAAGQNITGTCSLNVSVNKTIFFGRGNPDGTIGQDTDWRTFS